MVLKNENSLYVQYNQVFDNDQQRNLFEFAKENYDNFKISNVGGNNQLSHHKYRSSTVMQFNLNSYRELLSDIIYPEIKDICAKLEIAGFEIGRVELQLTSHNDGDYYLWHQDIGKEKGSAQRRLTFVYYFFHEPKQFSGGELGLYPKGKEPVIISPENNSIIFFNPTLLHDVKPVVCPGRIFENGRFTLNGWYHAAE